MTNVKVLKPFRDLVEHVDRCIGDEFTTSDERAKEIAEKLPAYVECEAVPEKEKPSKEPDLASLKVAQLKAMAKEQNVDLPKNATKAQIIEAIEE